MAWRPRRPLDRRPFPMVMRSSMAAALTLIALAAGACGGSSGGGSTVLTTLPPPTKARLALGAQVFVQDCARCHTLAAAHATGTAGPNLDRIRLPGFFAVQQVRNGSGTMPAFQG